MNVSTIPHLANVADETGRWSELKPDEATIQQLSSLCHSQDRLKSAGYIVGPMTSKEKLARLRCENCTAIMDLSQPSVEESAEEPTKKSSKKTRVCSYHTEKPVRGVFQCCGKNMFQKGGQKGCQISASHKEPSNYLQLLTRHWQFHESSTSRTMSITDQRQAVALDCEFGANKYNEPELIRISLVDFFSGQTLIDELVYPQIALKHCNTRYSGITKRDLEVARQRRSCLSGRNAARNKLLTFVGPETIIVAHSGSGDLGSLRLIHPLVVDTQIVDTKFKKVEGSRGLKNLCEKRLGIKVQQGRKGHDSVEDALATRELLLYYLTHMDDIVETEEDDKIDDSAEIQAEEHEEGSESGVEDIDDINAIATL